MEYTEQGLTLHPAVPESLANLEVSSFRYRQAMCDIVVRGWGTAGVVRLDGVEVNHIPTNLQGRHSIEVMMNQRQVER